MKTINKSRNDMTARERYKLSNSPDIQKMSNIAGETVTVTDWLFFEDVNRDGESTEILSIATDSGVYATNSKTFIEAFFEIVDVLAEDGETVTDITVGTGTSKAGRDYITCILK